MRPIGSRTWAIPEGHIPSWSNGPEPEMLSHETCCVLNAGDEQALLEITVYFEEREPVGPYRVTVPPRRTRHIRFNDLDSPEPIPAGVDFASLVRSNIPVVIQHTRLDSRQSENALMSTIAFPVA